MTRDRRNRRRYRIRLFDYINQKTFFADFLYNRVPTEITIANITTLYCIGAK